MTTARRKRARVEVETVDYIRGFLARAIKGAGKRVSDGDPVDLAELVRLRAEFDEVIVDAVRGMRERHGYSWADIARELGTTRQAAHATFGNKIRSRTHVDTMSA